LLLRLLRGLVYEIRPLPMGAALLAALLGVRVAHGELALAFPFLALVFLGLYAGHLLDSYVDYELRHEPKLVYLGIFEDSGGLLAGRELLAATAVSLVAFATLLASVAHAGLAFVLVALSGAAIAVAYAPLLDRNPVTVSLAYPVGVVAAFLGGALWATPSPDPRLALFALVLATYLVGGKIVSDEIDLASDAAMGKRTAQVALGRARARRLGHALCVAGLAVATALALTGVASLVSLVGVAGAAALLAQSARMPVERGIVVLVAGGYVYLVTLFVA